MNVFFTTFIGLGDRTSLDIKLKSGNRIILRHLVETKCLSDCDVGVLETFLKDVSEQIHRAGFQKLSGWFDLWIKDLDYEDSATYKYAVIVFIQGLGHKSFTVEPIL